MTGLSTLPPELLQITLDQLPPRSQYAASLTCRTFHTLLKASLAVHAQQFPDNCVVDLSTVGSREDGENGAWEYLDAIISGDHSAEYVERMMLYDRWSQYTEPQEWPEDDLEEVNSDNESDGGQSGSKRDQSLEARAPQWWNQMKDDLFFDGLPTGIKCSVDEVDLRASLKELVYQGHEAPIVLKLILLAENVRDIWLETARDDTILLAGLSRIAQMYHRGLKIPNALNDRPLQFLRRVTIYTYSHAGLPYLRLFSSIPSVEYLKTQRDLSISVFRAHSESDWPKDTWIPIETGPSNVKELIIRSLKIGTEDTETLLGMMPLLRTYFNENDFSFNPNVRSGGLYSSSALIRSLAHTQKDTLEKLWLAPDSTQQSTVLALEDIQERGMRLAQVTSTFKTLRLIRCDWMDIVDLADEGLNVLAKSLEVLLLLKVPDGSGPTTIQWLDKLPNLSVIHATSGDQRLGVGDGTVKMIKEESERRGLTWASFEDFKRWRMAVGET